MPQIAADFCIECGYRLQGLPPRHRCPECGTLYDERVRAWRPANSRRLILALLAAQSFLFMQCFNVLRMFTSNGKWVFSFGIICFAADAGIIAWAVTRYLQTSKRGFIVAPSPGGLTLRTATDDVQILWGQIESVTSTPTRKSFRSKPTSPGVTVKGTDGKSLIVERFFETQSEVDEFLATFDAAHHAYFLEGSRRA